MERPVRQGSRWQAVVSRAILSSEYVAAGLSLKRQELLWVSTHTTPERQWGRRAGDSVLCLEHHHRKSDVLMLMTISDRTRCLWSGPLHRPGCLQSVSRADILRQNKHLHQCFALVGLR